MVIPILCEGLPVPPRTSGLINPQLLGNTLPAATFEMTTRVLTLCPAEPRQNAEAVLKTYELFIYEHIH